jgi:hypothetical protein
MPTSGFVKMSRKPLGMIPINGQAVQKKSLANDLHLTPGIHSNASSII